MLMQYSRHELCCNAQLGTNAAYATLSENVYPSLSNSSQPFPLENKSTFLELTGDNGVISLRGEDERSRSRKDEELAVEAENDRSGGGGLR